MENEHKREVIEVEADTLQDFMNEELDRDVYKRQVKPLYTE